jgi:predicted ATPase
MLAIAFTGGPGFGKTTTLSALETRGYKCVPESARAIIQERMRMGLPKRPPLREFAEWILRLDQVQYRRARKTPGPVFFDRGVIDALGSCHELGLSSVAGLQDILNDYPFHSFATTDDERDQTFEEAVAVDDAVRRWYGRCGIELIDVPCEDVHARCDFILARLSLS